MSEEETASIAGMARLPTELIFRIFMFKPQYFRHSRLVCRAWMGATEEQIRSIKINGDFLTFHQGEREACVKFIGRCKVRGAGRGEERNGKRGG